MKDGIVWCAACWKRWDIPCFSSGGNALDPSVWGISMPVCSAPSPRKRWRHCVVKRRVRESGPDPQLPGPLNLQLPGRDIQETPDNDRCEAPGRDPEERPNMPFAERAKPRLADLLFLIILSAPV